MTFDSFVAIDWTGAVGERHRAIAVAVADTGDSAPKLLTRDRAWSRAEVFDLIAGFARRNERVLIGIDASFALPFADAEAFFPGDPSPPDARSLWAEVAAVAADDPHHAAHAYVAHRRHHFWTGAHDGPRADRARLRVVERRKGSPASCFVLLGASQCGKASLSAMRLLAATPVPVWPFDPLPATGPVLAEIYCSVFAAAAGVRGKIRDRATLDAALDRLGSAPTQALPDIFADHIGDALISAAGMRAAAADPTVWHPAGLDEVRATEGWTFGVA